ncbi:DUF4249 family protein [Flavobacterium sp. Sd200]|uniref:DUF4249 domain-containing protein n=1 Tax=Flavobacterium sp. Sd200 TaxID=2692211 RepID=UPI001367E9EB|nr:DUF4249 domain-containing protein [Flavobacterium sp. Sd200]MXN92430.1 DUF4249 family protein [Flavobacterium sp. Sd200]
MKNIQYISLLFILMLFASCEEVVNVDLDTAPPRLVVEASIDWVKGTSGSDQTIKLTKTRGYYDTVIPIVEGATVFVTNSTGEVFNFTEEAGTGRYNCTNFRPVVNETYVLTVVSEGQTYTATEKMYAAPDITRTIQNNEGGILGENIEIRFFYNDFPGQDNYYLTRFEAPVIPFPEYELADDEFFQGNEMFDWFSDEDLAPGHVVSIRLHGISQRYYEYMNVLLEAAGGGGGPFSAVPVAARGNLVNQDNTANYALGYFRLCEVSALQVTVQ